MRDGTCVFHLEALLFKDLGTDELAVKQGPGLTHSINSTGKDDFFSAKAYDFGKSSNPQMPIRRATLIEAVSADVDSKRLTASFDSWFCQLVIGFWGGENQILLLLCIYPYLFCANCLLSFS